MKRLFDFMISLLALCILAFPFVIIAILVRLTSHGPALYWSERIGKNGQSFMMPKFRTMRLDTPEVATDKLELPKNYYTPIGGFLRRTSLDEIPQFYSVICGDMSLVGPRPALFNQDELISERRKLGIDRLLPGITGWAQINGRDDISDQQKIQLDYEYYLNNNLVQDIRIIFWTVLAVISSQGIRH